MFITTLNKIILKISLGSLFVFTVFISSASADSNNQKNLCSKVISYVQPGDVVFTAVDSFAFRKVAELTLTWTSHVGVVFKKNDQWVVYESRIPISTITPLCDFVERSAEGQVSLKRYNQPLSENNILILQNAASDRLGYFYHPGFDYDTTTRYFCSKYVYDVYQEIGINVGQIETFQKLFENNPKADVGFWTKWYLGSIPWTRRTVTPASQLNDPNWITIFSNNVSH